VRAVVRQVARLALGWRSILPPTKRVVFAFHDVSTPDQAQFSRQYSTHPDTFARQLDLLQEVFKLVTLDEVVAPAPPGPKPLAAITFDDGFVSVGSCAQPILAQRKIPFTLFLNGRAMREQRLDYLPEYDPPRQGPALYLRAEEVIKLARAGVQIGNHTTSHRPLVGCTEGELNEEIVHNKAYLEELIGAPVRHFALPYGKKQHYDSRSLTRCFASGHTSVFSTNPTCFDSESLPDFKCAPIPRIDLTGASQGQVLFLVNRTLFRRIDI
jgi:peptidoglycan/xylan/chitin deacetylase (PgdA/CDA1 family)